MINLTCSCDEKLVFKNQTIVKDFKQLSFLLNIRNKHAFDMVNL